MRVMKGLMFVLLLFFMTANSAPKKDPKVEKQIKDLLSKMTLDEKIGQMSQRNPWSGRVEEEYANWIKDQHLGSFLNAGGSNAWKIKNDSKNCR